MANEHLVKYVNVCLRDIWFFKAQNGMESQQGEYCLLISLQFSIIGA